MPRQQLFAPTRTASPGPGTKRRRLQRQVPSEPRARPACQRPGRPLAGAALPSSARLPLYFLQPTPLLLQAAEKPVTVIVATASSQRRRRRSDSAPPPRSASSRAACSRRRRCSNRAGPGAGVGDWRAAPTARAPLPGAALRPARAAGPTEEGYAGQSPVAKPRARAQIPERVHAWLSAKSLSWLRRAGGPLQMGVCVAAAQRADSWE